MEQQKYGLSPKRSTRRPGSGSSPSASPSRTADRFIPQRQTPPGASWSLRQPMPVTDEAGRLMYQLLLRNELLDGSSVAADSPMAQQTSPISAAAMISTGTLSSARVRNLDQPALMAHSLAEVTPSLLANRLSGSPSAAGNGAAGSAEGSPAATSASAAAAGDSATARDREIQRRRGGQSAAENVQLITSTGLPASVLSFSPVVATAATASSLTGSLSSSPPLASTHAGPARFSLSPLSEQSQRLLQAPMPMPRKIPKAPFKVLDAPELEDDFYLNLLDWSSTNILAVGLKNCVYLWSAATAQVTKLCELENILVCSVKWMQWGSIVAVGTDEGNVQLWDAGKCQFIRQMTGHALRVASLAWAGNMLASGSRDRHIFLRDSRAPEPVAADWHGHRQEVCGLQFSPDEQILASGGNDNKIFLWQMGKREPLHRFVEHQAGVKGLAWSPHQHGLLASGGGTNDQCIRFWNTLTGQPLQWLNTGSQVCNLLWSRTSNELVSTHGYSRNEVVVWQYPSMSQLANLVGHTHRVLYLAAAPDGQTIVTGAGDETLRFWSVFAENRARHDRSSVLRMYSDLR